MDDTGKIDLERVCEILSIAHHVKAYVEHTGGGCATLYAGARYLDAEDEVRFAVIAGPGWFESTRLGNPHGYASLDDFYIGADDDGESDAIDYAAYSGEDAEKSEEDIAQVIAAMAAEYVTNHPHVTFQA